MIGSRHPEKEDLKIWQQSVGKHASIGNTTDAAKFGEILIVAVNWAGIEEVLHHARPEGAGKVVIDLTDPLEYMGTAEPTLAVGHDMSGGEIVQQLLPDSNVVKTLNIVSHTHMAQPHYFEGTPSMFMCGNNPSAKEAVMNLLKGLGWHDVTDIGDITKSRLLEPLCLLWVAYGKVHGTEDHAFAVLKK
jgi:predicted dinucleotide-binding enzyme